MKENNRDRLEDNERRNARDKPSGAGNKSYSGSTSANPDKQRIQTVEANDIDEPLRTAKDSENGERTRGDGPGMVNTRTVSRDDEDI